MFCATCGTRNDEADRFCRGCGATMAAGRAPDALAAQPAVANFVAPSWQVGATVLATGKVCPACGRTYPASQRFCHADGTALAGGVAPVASVVANAPPPPPEAPAPLPTPISLEQAEAAPPPGPPTSPPQGAPPAPEIPQEVPPELEPAVTAVSGPLAGLDAPLAPEATQHCPSCGLTFPAAMRFCDQDGSPLAAGGKEAVDAAAERGEAPWLASYAPVGQPDEDRDSSAEEDREGGGKLVPALVATTLLLLFGGGGYAFWSGAFDRWLANPPPLVLTPEAACLEVDTAAVIRAEAVQVCGDARAKATRDEITGPVLRGRYKVDLADQNIVLSIDGAVATSDLRSFTATLTYTNIVTNETCIAALAAVGDREGSKPGLAVSFRQAAIPGREACPAEIPVTLDITGQPTDANRVVRSIVAEWRKPGSDEVLMKGTLQREVGQ